MNVDEALSWIAELFEEPVDAIRPEVSAEDIPAWDSLGILTLMAGLDEEYGIQLSDEELQNLNTVNDILDLLKRYGHL